MHVREARDEVVGVRGPWDSDKDTNSRAAISGNLVLSNNNMNDSDRNDINVTDDNTYSSNSGRRPGTSGRAARQSCFSKFCYL